MAGLDGLGQLDTWEETSGLLKRQFYVAGQEDGEAAVRNAYFGQFEGHAGYQLLISALLSDPGLSCSSPSCDGLMAHTN